MSLERAKDFWSAASLSEALQRVSVQRAILGDLPGLLEGMDYQHAFESGLIDGEWRWSDNFKRRYRNGWMPTATWPVARCALVHVRRHLNLTQSWNLIGRDFGERPRQIRQAGREAVLHMMKTVET